MTEVLSAFDQRSLPRRVNASPAECFFFENKEGNLPEKSDMLENGVYDGGGHPPHCLLLVQRMVSDERASIPWEENATTEKCIPQDIARPYQIGSTLCFWIYR